MWITIERILEGAPTSVGAMSGAVAGLVTCLGNAFRVWGLGVRV